MAYRCPSAPSQVRLRTFASPNIDYRGNPTGVSYEADATNAADGPRALNLTAATVAAGSTYRYRVRAQGPAGLSEPSNVASVTTATIVPQVPTAGVKVTK